MEFEIELNNGEVLSGECKWLEVDVPRDKVEYGQTQASEPRTAVSLRDVASVYVSEW